jgi:hypothetical protein
MNLAYLLAVFANRFLKVSENGVQLSHVMGRQRLSDKLHNSIF